MKHLKLIERLDILDRIRKEASKLLATEDQPNWLAQDILTEIRRNNFGDEITDKMIEEETFKAFNS